MIRLIMLLLFRCYSKEKSGYKYYSNVVRDVVTVDTLSQCAGRCDREVFCNSFSFRYLESIVTSRLSSVSSDSLATMTKTTVYYLASTPVTSTPVVTWFRIGTGTSGSTSAGLLWPPTGGL